MLCVPCSVIVGHQRIRESLKKAAERGNIGHAYLFSGPEGVGKMTVALEFAKMLQHTQVNTDLRAPSAFNTDKHKYDCKTCQDIERGAHPDVTVVFPQDSKEIRIEQIRQLKRALQFTSHSAPYKIAIIDYAEKMNQESSNAFLKTLEEPHKKTVLIVITTNRQALLPTIVSRCQVVNFLPLKTQEIEYFLNHQRLSALPSASLSVQEAARLSCGCPGKAIRIISNQLELKELRIELAKFLESDLTGRFRYIESVCKDDAKISHLLGDWLIVSRDILLAVYNCPDLIVNKSQGNFLAAAAKRYPLQNLIKTIGAIRQIKFLIETTNINTRLALESLAMEI